MNQGKQRCEALRAIRIKLAEANGLEYTPHECTFEGDCYGSCPLCDAELERLTDGLTELKRSGRTVNYDVLTFDERELFRTSTDPRPEDRLFDNVRMGEVDVLGQLRELLAAEARKKEDQ